MLQGSHSYFLVIFIISVVLCIVVDCAFFDRTYLHKSIRKSIAASNHNAYKNKLTFKILEIRGGSEIDDSSDSDSDFSEEDSEDEDEVVQLVHGKKILNEKLKTTKKEGILDKLQKNVYKILDEKFNNITQDESFPMMVTTVKQVVAAMVITRLINSLNHDDPKAVSRARLSFVGYLLLTQVLIFFSRIKIATLNDETTVEIPAQPNPLAGLFAPPPGEDEDSSSEKGAAKQQKTEKMTARDYDLKELNQMRNALVFPILFSAYLHLKKGLVKPLMIQACLGIYQTLTSPLIQIHIFGRSAEGELARPFNRMRQTRAGTKEPESVGGDNEPPETEKAEQKEGDESTSDQDTYGQDQENMLSDLEEDKHGQDQEDMLADLEEDEQESESEIDEDDEL